MVKEILEAAPSVSPLDNPWVVSEKAKPTIRRIGIDFFRDVLLRTHKLEPGDLADIPLAKNSQLKTVWPEW
jgi:hypothetical protein